MEIRGERKTPRFLDMLANFGHCDHSLNLFALVIERLATESRPIYHEMHVASVLRDDV